MDWETLVEDYTNRFLEKGIDEGVAIAMAERLADADMDIYRAVYRILDANCLDVAIDGNHDRLLIPNFDKETKQ